MTADEWDHCTDVEAMSAYLRDSRTASDRKLRLLACAFCRLIWDFPNDERPRRALEAAERYADATAPVEGLVTSYCEVNSCLYPLGRRYTPHIPADLMDDAFVAFLRTVSTGEAYYGGEWEHSGRDAYRDTADAADRVVSVAEWCQGSPVAAQKAEATMIRCVCGNPFRPLQPHSPSVLSWQNRLVVHLAEAAYELRCLPSGHLDPDRLAVLADALEDAGCDDAVLLGHLREAGPHVRGCIAVDAVLGRT